MASSRAFFLLNHHSFFFIFSQLLLQSDGYVWLRLADPIFQTTIVPPPLLTQEKEREREVVRLSSCFFFFFPSLSWSSLVAIAVKPCYKGVDAERLNGTEEEDI